MNELTESQERVYKSIKEYIKTNKISPSIRDLCKINGFTAPGTLTYHLKILKEKGYITYRDKTPRSIVLIEN
jgi:repressor LexA